MKFLFVNSVCGIRSTGRIVTDLAEARMAEGHECIIAYGREIVPEKYKSLSYRIGTDVRVNINGFKARLLDNEGFNARHETETFIEFANNYNPDVIWLHNLHGYYINIDLLFNWIKSRPHMQVKWTLHDCWAFTGHCTHFMLAKCEKWKTECSYCPQKSCYPASILKDNSEQNYNRKKAAFTGVKNMTLITPSRWLADLVKHSFLGDYPIEVQYNTIDLNVFKPTPSNFRETFGLTDKKIILGVASVWDERKGLTDFIRLSEMIDDRYAIVLVGVNKKQAKFLPRSITTILRTNNTRELAEIYTAADVFVNMTYEDNYPTVNLESQACGTPCLTYRTGGSVESVMPDCVVEQGDLQAMLKKIEEITTKGEA